MSGRAMRNNGMVSTLIVIGVALAKNVSRPLTKIRTMNVKCPTCGGLGFVPDNDNEHEEIIRTSR